MTNEQILADFPDLTAEDIRACLAFAADRERRLMMKSVDSSSPSIPDSISRRDASKSNELDHEVHEGHEEEPDSPPSCPS